LRNARIIQSSGVAVIFRIPLITGLTDSDKNLRAIANFIRSLGGDTKINLLPYHRYGTAKYEMLDRIYPCRNVISLTEKKVEHVKNVFHSMGVECKVEE
jgi:pyruvate formate lyase activating enzyme